MRRQRFDHERPGRTAGELTDGFEESGSRLPCRQSPRRIARARPARRRRRAGAAETRRPGSSCRCPARRRRTPPAACQPRRPSRTIEIGQRSCPARRASSGVACSRHASLSARPIVGGVGHRRNEQVTALGKGLDEAWSLGAIPERSPDLEDVTAKDLGLDVGVRPDRLNQFVGCHQPAGMLDQMTQAPRTAWASMPCACRPATSTGSRYPTGTGRTTSCRAQRAERFHFSTVT